MKTITVEEVHREFLTAADVMLDNYTESKRKTLENKIDRLSKLGFNQCKDVAQKPNLEAADKLGQLIEQYSMSHPNNKIISEVDVKRLCEKYGLVYGPIQNFTGFVPEKNLREIEAFYHKDLNTWVLFKTAMLGVTTFNETPVAEYYTEIAALEALQKLEEKSDSRSIIDTWSPSRLIEFFETRKKGSFLIAAPKADMIVDMNQQIVDSKIVPVAVPDPVVLFPIAEGFYLIVTAWGDEASDPLVVNEKFN